MCKTTDMLIEITNPNRFDYLNSTERNGTEITTTDSIV